MKYLKKLSGSIDKTSDFIGKIAMWSSIILLAVTVFEVISRRFFNKPTIWTYEFSLMLFGLFIMFTIPYGMLHNVNVSVDVFFGRWSPKTQKIALLITYILLLFPFLAALTYSGYNFFIPSWLLKEKSWSVWSPPIYPIKASILIAAFIAFLQGISELIKIWLGDNMEGDQ